MNHALKMILLFTLSWTAYGSVDFELTSWGPQTVVQGHLVMIGVKGIILSGDDEQATLLISGLPYGASARYPLLEKYCCANGTKVWRIHGNTVVEISTGPDTPTGSYEIELTYLSDSAVSRSLKLPLTVLPQPPKPKKPHYGRDFPLSGFQEWREHMQSYGAKYCAWPLSTWEGSVWYYDGARVYSQMFQMLQDEYWAQCAEEVADFYGGYVLQNNGNIPGYRVFAEGLKADFVSNDNLNSYEAVRLLDERHFGSANVSYLIRWQTSREIAYSLEAQLTARSLNIGQQDDLEATVEAVFGHFDQWFISKTATYVQPFMVALSAEALIQYYDVSGDVRVPWILGLAADAMWETSWDESSKSFFYYSESSANPAVDLNLLIAPLYGWLFRQTGEEIYRQRGDEIFEAGVKGAWLGDGKHFNQNYRWSGKYVEWRTAPEKPSKSKGGNSGLRNGAASKRGVDAVESGRE